MRRHNNGFVLASFRELAIQLLDDAPREIKVTFNGEHAKKKLI